MTDTLNPNLVSNVRSASRRTTENSEAMPGIKTGELADNRKISHLEKSAGRCGVSHFFLLCKYFIGGDRFMGLSEGMEFEFDGRRGSALGLYIIHDDGLFTRQFGLVRDIHTEQIRGNDLGKRGK